MQCILIETTSPTVFGIRCWSVTSISSSRSLIGQLALVTLAATTKVLRV